MGLFFFFITTQELTAQIDPSIPLQVQGIDLAEIYGKAEMIKTQRALAELRRAQASAQNQTGRQNAEIARLQRELLELQIQKEQFSLDQMQKNAGEPNYNPPVDRYVGLSGEIDNGGTRTCSYTFGTFQHELSVASHDDCPEAIHVRE